MHSLHALLRLKEQQPAPVLRVATRNGHTAVVQLLLQHGANANAAVEAAYQGHTDILRLLIGSGLDLARRGAELIW